VQEQLLDFKKTVSDGIAALEKRGPFVQKTLATLAGLRDPHEIRMVLKGAFPHSPTKTESDLVSKISETIGNPDIVQLAGGGSWVSCGVGCAICAGAGACMACCVILM
jgi:hypothetical protein